MEDVRKWEDMPTDCLVNILGRLPIESRLLDVPLVCKPWLQAVRNPFCWQNLIFQNYHRSRLIGFAINLSQRRATSLALPHNCSIEDFTYVTEECPALKMLVLPEHLWRHNLDIFIGLTVKLKNLEIVGLGRNELKWITCEFIRGIVKHIGIHLPNFIGVFVTNTHIDDDIASAIVWMLKQLLKQHKAEHSKEDLFFILHGCREPVGLRVSRGSDDLGDVMFNFPCIRFDDYYVNIFIMKKLKIEGHCDRSTKCGNNL